MTFEETVDVIEKISCPPYELELHGGGLSEAIGREDRYLQVSAMLPDADTLRPATMQRGRKWRLSGNTTRQEIVQTALAAVLMFAEHEIRESFKYKGRAIFGPHLDIDLLAAIADGAGRPTPTTAHFARPAPLYSESAEYMAETDGRQPDRVPPGDARIIIQKAISITIPAALFQSLSDICELARQHIENTADGRFGNRARINPADFDYAKDVAARLGMDEQPFKDAFRLIQEIQNA